MKYDESSIEVRDGGAAFVRKRPKMLFIRASSEREAWMNVRYRVDLSQTERDELKALPGGGRHAARKLTRARMRRQVSWLTVHL